MLPIKISLPDRLSGKTTSGKPESCLFSRVWLISSLVLLLFLSYSYELRPLHLAAITVLPIWSWVIAGLISISFVWRRRHAKLFKVSAVLWLAFLLYFADEPWSLLRTPLPVAEVPKAKQLRVVTLNCNSGDPLIAEEVAPLQPDIVLLQESPSRADVNKLARKLFGTQAGVLWGVDGSIIARGRIKPRALQAHHSVFYVQGRVHLPDGYEVEVMSLRLMTPPFRVDLWSPDCWNAYRENKQIQHSQMDLIYQQLYTISDSVPVVVGGDFNAPQGDGIFRYLSAVGLNDSFQRAGRGWGNTIINDFPALRIDQIWASQHLKARNVVAHRTLTSDHRAVIADFEK